MPNVYETGGGYGAPVDDEEEYPDVMPMSQYSSTMNRPISTAPPAPTAAPPRDKIDVGGIGGLAALIGAAIAGPNSGVGHLLSGGVTQYANNQMKKQLQKQKQDASQHEALVKTIYTKVPDLIRQAPNDPGVQELQKMWVEALADDNIVSPKEAADMSAKIHAIEGKVGRIYEEETANKARQKAAADKQDQMDRAAFEQLQASHPNLQGVSYEDAKKTSWFKEAVGKINSQRAAKERAFAEAAMGLSDYTTLGGQQVQIPNKELVENDAALRRAREMAAASAGRIGAQQGGQNTRLDESQKLKIAQDTLEAARKIPPQMWDKFYGPKFRDNVAAAEEFMQSKMREGMTPPPGDGGRGVVETGGGFGAPSGPPPPNAGPKVGDVKRFPNGKMGRFDGRGWVEVTQ